MLYFVNRGNQDVAHMGLFDLPDSMTPEEFRKIHNEFTSYLCSDIFLPLKMGQIRPTFNGPYVDIPDKSRGRHLAPVMIDGKKKYPDIHSKEWNDFLFAESESAKTFSDIYHQERAKRKEEYKTTYGDMTTWEMFCVHVKEKYNIVKLDCSVVWW